MSRFARRVALAFTGALLVTVGIAAAQRVQSSASDVRAYREPLRTATKGAHTPHHEALDARQPLHAVSVDIVTPGVPKPRPTPRPLRRFVQHVFFCFREARLRAERRVVDRVADQILRLSPSRPVLVRGHTDNKGKRSLNRMLSRTRAVVVADRLKRRLRTTPIVVRINWYGERKPVAKNQKPNGSDHPLGRARNRRAVVKILARSRRPPPPTRMSPPKIC